MKKKKSKKKNIILITILIIALLVILSFAFIFIKKDIDNKKYQSVYNQAIELLDNKDFDSAIEKFKSISNYKDSDKRIIESYYLYAKYKIESNDYKSAIDLLEKCIDYKDSKELQIDSKYNYALKIKTSNEKESINILNEISDYKDSKDIIDKYNYEHRFDGTYSDKGSSGLGYQKRYIINGLPSKISTYSYDTRETTYGDDKYSAGYSALVSVELKCNEDYTICTSEDDNFFRTYIFGDDKIIYKPHNKKPKSWDLDYIDMEYTYYKISDETDLPKERTKIGSAKPQIGMTADEVKKSSWGKPQKINKSTYEWGTTEQWVYSNNRYVYFKNGKVTSISE